MDGNAPWFDWSHPLNKVARKRPTIDELEHILQREDDVEIEILPNGEIRSKGGSSDADRAGRKPLTMRENLGGEYAVIWVN